MDAALRFDILRDARGDTYHKLLALDGFLAGVGEVSERRLVSADWEDRVLATILRARAQDRAIFEEVDADLARIDPALEARKASGPDGPADNFAARAEQVWGRRCLPVALEGITRRVPEDAAWRTSTYVAMLGGVPDALSVAPVAALLISADSDQVRMRAARTLTFLPREAAVAARENLGARSDEITRALAYFDRMIAR